MAHIHACNNYSSLLSAFLLSPLSLFSPLLLSPCHLLSLPPLSLPLSLFLSSVISTLLAFSHSFLICSLAGILNYGAAYFCLKLIRYSLLFWLPYYLSVALQYEKETAGVCACAVARVVVVSMYECIVFGCLVRWFCSCLVLSPWQRKIIVFFVQAI